MNYGNEVVKETSGGDDSLALLLRDDSKTQELRAICVENDDRGKTVIPEKTSSNMSLQNINDDYSINDVKIETTKGRVSTSPCMVTSASKSQRLNLHESNSLPWEDIKHFGITRAIQTLEVAFSSTDYIPPIKKTGMRDIIEKKMNMINDDVLLSEYNDLIARSVKVIENHGLVHGGENIRHVDWRILGENEKDVEFQSDSKWNYDDLFPEEVCRRTRASSRVRNSLIQSLVKDLAGDDVFKFHDVGDSSKEDINGYPDFEVKEERSEQWKEKGMGKKSEKIGGGRGRPRKGATVEDNPSIKEYYSPVKTQEEDTEEETMLNKAGNMSPFTAACNRPGLSGYRQQIFSPERRSSPRNKTNMGECPLCGQNFATNLLEYHAARCEG